MSFGNKSDGAPGLNQNHAWGNTLIFKRNGGGLNQVSIALAKQKVGNKTYAQMNDEEKLWYVAGLLASMKGQWADGDGGATLRNIQPKSRPPLGMPRPNDFPLPLDTSVAPNVTLDLGQIFTLLWRNLSAYFGRPIKYVFITIDRDAIQNHQTQWGDFCFFPDAVGLSRVIAAIADALFVECPGSKLIGFDITGLPEARAVYDQWSNVLVAAGPSWQEVQNELEALYPWAARRVQLDSTFLSRALIIFSNLVNDIKGKTLKTYVSTDTKSTINSFWSRFNTYKGGSRSSTDVMSFRERLGPDLTKVRDGLRTASRSVGLPKEHKSSLLSYASRIDDLLNLEG